MPGSELYGSLQLSLSNIANLDVLRNATKNSSPRPRAARVRINVLGASGSLSGYIIPRRLFHCLALYETQFETRHHVGLYLLLFLARINSSCVVLSLVISSYLNFQQSSIMAPTLSSIKGRPVTVLGGGVLGRRIACTWVAGGWDVKIRDPDPSQRNAALHYIENNVSSYASVIGTTPGKASAYEDLAEAVKDAWTVIEAVPEKLSLKIDTFADLERFGEKDAILVSNSSSYKSSEMLEKVGKDARKRIMNTHYMMPPDNRIVELMTDGETEADLFPFYVERLREVGMHPIVAQRESTGFVFNRVWAAIKRECLTILAEEVSTPEQLDRVWMEMFGSKAGPCTMMDSVGLDTVEFIEQHYIKERGFSGEKTVDFLRKNYISQGKLGAKSGKGGLYPPGHTTKATGENKTHHDNLHAPSL